MASERSEDATKGPTDSRSNYYLAAEAMEVGMYIKGNINNTP